MNKITLKASLFATVLLSAFSGYGQNIDLVPGINYSYDPADAQGVIDIAEVNICNNESDNASAFDISMYLYDENTTDYWIIATERLNAGLSGNACVPAQNWVIDIDDTPGIPAGTYRLGIWVDSNEEITETDENNNTTLLSGNNTYSPSSTSSVEENQTINNVTSYPNPVSDHLNLQFNVLNSSAVKIQIFDINGRKVYNKSNSNMQNGSYVQKIDISNLNNGVYNLSIQSDDNIVVKKIVVSH